MKTPRSYTQDYNVQAVVTEEQIVLAAEVSASSPDFGHVAPMVKATKRELRAIGVGCKVLWVSEGGCGRA